MWFQQGRVALRRDEEWRTKLAPDARRVVSGITLPMRALWGYTERS